MFLKSLNSYQTRAASRRQALRARRRGTVAYVVAGSMIMILGFSALAVDYGLLVNDKNQAQRAVDAAALAGAQELTEPNNPNQNMNNARRIAVEVAAQNNTTVESARITFNADATEITVPATVNQPLYFARVLGIGSKNVSTTATARAGGGATTPRVVPIGITTETYQQYAPGGVPLAGTGNRAEILFINHKHSSFGLNNFVLFDLRSVDTNAKSPAHMRRQLEGLEDVDVQVGNGTNAVDSVDMTNANASGSFFLNGMRTRFLAAAAAPWHDVQASPPTDALGYIGQNYDSVLAGQEPTVGGGGNRVFTFNARIMDLIVTNAMGPKAGNTNSPVLDFAPVYVERIDPVTGGIKMTVRFLPKNLGMGSGSAGVSLIN